MVRDAVMITVICVWVVVVLVSLIRGIVPDAITWGVPGAVWLALHPTPRRAPDPPPSTPAPVRSGSEDT